MNSCHFSALILMFSFFLCGICLFFKTSINEVSEKVDRLTEEMQDLEKEIETLRESNRRILEQNIELSTEIILKEIPEN